MSLINLLKTTKDSLVHQGKRSPAEYHVYRILYVLFFLLPSLAGIDKFFHKIVNWDIYVSPLILKETCFSAHDIMLFAGPIEILIGCLVAINPAIGSIAVSLMLSGIVLDLLTIPGSLHIAMLDLSLCLAAVCLHLLSRHPQNASRRLQG